jgi:hypothetical protein
MLLGPGPIQWICRVVAGLGNERCLPILRGPDIGERGTGANSDIPIVVVGDGSINAGVTAATLLCGHDLLLLGGGLLGVRRHVGRVARYPDLCIFRALQQHKHRNLDTQAVKADVEGS